MILMWLAVAPYPLKQFIAITFPENTSPPSKEKDPNIISP